MPSANVYSTEYVSKFWSMQSPRYSRPPEPLAETGHASFIQQHSSILWIRKSLKQPPLAQRNPWNFWIW